MGTVGRADLRFRSLPPTSALSKTLLMEPIKNHSEEWLACINLLCRLKMHNPIQLMPDMS